MFPRHPSLLQLTDFLGNNANAVKWQVWTALLVYVQLRFQSWRGRWGHSFSRLLTLLRAALWQKRDLHELVDRYGTAGGDYRSLDSPRQAELPGFESVLMG